MDEAVASKDDLTTPPKRPRTDLAEPLAWLVHQSLRRPHEVPRAATLVRWRPTADPDTGVASERPEQNGAGRPIRGLDHNEAVRAPHRIRLGSTLAAAALDHHLLQTPAPVVPAAIPHDRRPGGPTISVLAQRVEDGGPIAADDEEAGGRAHAGKAKHGSCPARRGYPAVNGRRGLPETVHSARWSCPARSWALARDALVKAWPIPSLARRRAALPGGTC